MNRRMTVSEWERAAKVAGEWEYDEVMNRNGGNGLYYKYDPQSDNGVYVEAMANGHASVGYFEYGFPYITDAEFQPVYSCKVANRFAAVKKVISSVCLPLPLIDLLIDEEYAAIK